VARAEFNHIVDLINERGDILANGLLDLRHQLDIQFKRIAQLQEELDRLKRERSS
jgi:hypothetical protein